MRKLTKRVIDAAKPADKRFAINDSEIPGFKVYVHPSDRKSFHLRYRVGGGAGGTIREPKIGEMGQITLEQARDIAADWSAIVRQGGDPSADRNAIRTAPKMVDLFERYLSDHARSHKKASSVANDERLIEKRLLPSLGRKKVQAVMRADVADLHHALAETPYEANRVLSLLSKALNLAEVWGWRPDGTNPCRHVKKFSEKKRKRFLSQVELARLGDALRSAESGELGPVSVSAVAAIRLLVLTGARKGEILGLRWTWINWEAARIDLPDSKTGEKAIHLPPAALSILQGLTQIDGNPHVLAGGKRGAALVNLKDPWGLIRKAADLEDVRIHDLRHSFASVGAAGGMSLPVIGALLGHTQAATTQRYAHLSDDPLRAAADQIGGKIADAMNQTQGQNETGKAG